MFLRLSRNVDGDAFAARLQVRVNVEEGRNNSGALRRRGGSEGGAGCTAPGGGAGEVRMVRCRGNARIERGWMA